MINGSREKRAEEIQTQDSDTQDNMSYSVFNL